MALKLIVKKQDAIGNESVKELVFEDLLITVGNGIGSTLYLDDSQIADEQLVLILEDNQTVLVNRAEGTFLNDEPIAREVRIDVQNGDEIQIGLHTISFLKVNYKIKSPLFAQTVSSPQVRIVDEVAITPEILPKLEKNGNGNGNKTNGHNNGNATDNDLKPQKSFADILSSLRKEEDRFYFQLESPDGAERLPIEKDEIVVGWDLTGRILSSDPNVVVMPRVSIKKDWSGVMVYPQNKESVWVNGELTENPRRLKNNDKLTFLSAFSSGPQKNVWLEFCEPAALVEINSILPQDLPSVAPDRADFDEPTSLENGDQINEVAAKGKNSKLKAKKSKRAFFGYFTFGEIFILLFGTIITAGLVFMILEYW